MGLIGVYHTLLSCIFLCTFLSTMSDDNDLPVLVLTFGNCVLIKAE